MWLNMQLRVREMNLHATTNYAVRFLSDIKFILISDCNSKHEEIAAIITINILLYIIRKR